MKVFIFKLLQSFKYDNIFLVHIHRNIGGGLDFTSFSPNTRSQWFSPMFSVRSLIVLSFYSKSDSFVLIFVYDSNYGSKFTFCFSTVFEVTVLYPLNSLCTFAENHLSMYESIAKLFYWRTNLSITLIPHHFEFGLETLVLVLQLFYSFKLNLFNK